MFINFSLQNDVALSHEEGSVIKHTALLNAVRQVDLYTTTKGILGLTTVI